MIRFALVFTLLVQTFLGLSQDSLVYHNGKKVAYKKYNWIPHAVEIQTMDNKWESVSADSLLGISMVAKEKTYYCLDNPDTTEEYSLLLVERLEAGPINLYRSKLEGLKFYVQKGKTIYNLYAGSRKEGTEKLKALVSDDNESVAYIESRDFDLKIFDIRLVVQKYNERHFAEHQPLKFEARGKVYLYRTAFQDTMERVKIEGYGQYHDLYINDFIVMDIPIEYPTRFEVFDPNNRNKVTIVGEFEDQYFEVRFDKKIGQFVFDKKQGSELLYEFSKISGKVEKKFKKGR